MSSNKSEDSKSVCAGEALQDGGSTFPTRSVTTRGLNDQNGSKRCLFPNSHTPESPALPPVCLCRETLQVSESPLWHVICTTSVITKTLKPMVGLLRQMGLRLKVYLNDQLEVMAPLLYRLFESLGLMMNAQKSLLAPTQLIEFLGFQVNSTH